MAYGNLHHQFPLGAATGVPLKAQIDELWSVYRTQSYKNPDIRHDESEETLQFITWLAELNLDLIRLIKNQ